MDEAMIKFNGWQKQNGSIHASENNQIWIQSILL